MLPDEKGKRLTSKQLLGEFEKKCESGTNIITDEYPGYDFLDKSPKVDLSLLDESYAPPPKYIHLAVNHKTGRFTAGPGIHTNGIEGFWSLLKGTLGTYRGVIDKYLQCYVDEICFRQNTLAIRGTQEEFDLLLKRCVFKP
jgi:transposase-like protein